MLICSNIGLIILVLVSFLRNELWAQTGQIECNSDSLLKQSEQTFRFDAQQSLRLADSAYNLSIEENNTENQIKSMLLTGRTESYLQNTFEATEAYIQVIDHEKISSFPDIKAEAYRGLALVNLFWENYEDAHTNIRNAQQVMTSEPNVEVKILGTKVVCFIRTKEYDSAIYYSQKVMNTYEELKDTLRLVYHINNHGTILLNQGNLDGALLLYKKALTLNEHANDIQAQSSLLSNLGHVYFQMGSIEKAKSYLKSGEEYALSINHYRFLPDNYKTQADLYKQVNNVDSAYIYMEKYAMMLDSVFDQKKAARINTLQNKYLQAKKQQEIQVLKARENQRHIFIWSLVIVNSLLVILFILYRKQSRLRAKLDKKKKESLNLELEYKERELTTNLVHSMEKGKLIYELKQNINTLVDSDRKERDGLINQIKSKLNQSIYTEKEWHKFKTHFEKIHPSFYKVLNEKHPELSQTDTRLCAYIKMNLSTKEIAAITNNELRTIQTSKYRIKKKMTLSIENDLVSYIQNL